MTELAGAQLVRNRKVVDQVHATDEYRAKQHGGAAAEHAHAEFMHSAVLLVCVLELVAGIERGHRFYSLIGHVSAPQMRERVSWSSSE